MIIPKYRRLKIGKSVAIELFNMHNGIWEVKPSYGNKGAFSFLKNVIDEYTNIEKVLLYKRTFNVYINKLIHI